MVRPMRLASVFAALLLLSACATSAPPASSSVSSAPARSPSALAGLLAQAGRPNAPNVAAIERAMGPADIRRQDGAGLALTYRLDSCALLLLFAADPRNE